MTWALLFQYLIFYARLPVGTFVHDEARGGRGWVVIEGVVGDELDVAWGPPTFRDLPTFRDGPAIRALRRKAPAA